ncbi:MAG: TrkA C-terminal domain-containing protein [Candidatus Hydrogenedentota bacterium]
MLGIVGIVACLTVLALSLIITRVATIALTLTGLSEQAARFQARSAFTGTGFTTSEAEKVVSHPVRRQIITILMFLRSAGLVTILISLILTFAESGSEHAKLHRLLWLSGGALFLGILSISRIVDRWLTRLLSWLLNRLTSLRTRDFESLLRLSGEYTVMEMQVEEDDWISHRTLAECELSGEGVMVLGVYRADGDYIGAPKGSTNVYPGDTLLLYGRGAVLEELDSRRAGSGGDAAHERAKDEQRRHEAEEETRERAHKQREEKRREEAQQQSTKG